MEQALVYNGPFISTKMYLWTGWCRWEPLFYRMYKDLIKYCQIHKCFNFYLHQRGDVSGVVCQQDNRKNYWPNSHEIWWRGVEFAKEEPMTY